MRSEDPALAHVELSELTREHVAVLAERDSLRAVIEKVREARANHPACDIHYGGDPVKCGWKRAVLDIDTALAGKDDNQ